MGCLEWLLFDLLGTILQEVFVPWLVAEPDYDHNTQLFFVLTVLTGTAAAGCYLWRSLAPAQNSLPTICMWIALVLCAYFALLTVIYWQRSRG